jgi:hypothetical protein
MPQQTQTPYFLYRKYKVEAQERCKRQCPYRQHACRYPCPERSPFLGPLPATGRLVSTPATNDTRIVSTTIRRSNLKESPVESENGLPNDCSESRLACQDKQTRQGYKNGRKSCAHQHLQRVRRIAYIDGEEFLS